MEEFHRIRRLPPYVFEQVNRAKAAARNAGADLLTNAIDLFTENDLPDKAAEANVILAFCYWNAGEVRECETILKSIEENYIQDIFHPVYLQIRINRLMVHYWNEEFDQGIELIKHISHPMEFCADIRLKTMFHNQAGMIYRRKQMTEESAIHYKQAMRFARESNNLRFAAATLNNLSLLYRDNEQYGVAHSFVDDAIEILKSINDGWFLPHTIDTKASIFLAEQKFDESLETIEKAIEIFEKSEDFRGFAEALWTCTKSLLRLDRPIEAFLVFGKLQQISRERIGETTAENFARALADEIYIPKGLPLLDEVAEFKKSRVARALLQAKGFIVKAAELLKLKNHKTLSQMLDKQFPELRDQLGFERRAVRSDSKPKQTALKKAIRRSVFLETKDLLEEREISRIVLPEKNYSFDFTFNSQTFQTFLFKKTQMEKFGVETNSVIAVFPLEDLKIGLPVIVSSGNELLVGNAEYDKYLGGYFIRDKTGFPVPINESNIEGEPLGYCPAEKIDDKFIRFLKLTN